MQKSFHGARVYSADARVKSSLIGMLLQMLKNCISLRQLIWQLVKRDLFNNYKKSLLGVSWHFIAPLTTAASWLFLQNAGIVSQAGSTAQYAQEVLLGITIWSFFSNTVLGLTNILSNASSFIAQVEFPHEILIVKQFIEQAINFLISMAFCLILIWVLGAKFNFTVILTPFLILPIFIISAPIGLLGSILSVLGKDFHRIIEILISFIFFLTPITYQTPENNSFLFNINKYNPLSYLIGEFKNLILEGRLENGEVYWMVVAVSLPIFLLSLRLFFVSENKVIEKIL